MKLPNGELIQYTQTSKLDLPVIKEESTQDHVIPNLENNSLLSIGKLCNNDYLEVFDNIKMKIYDNHNLKRI